MITISTLCDFICEDKCHAASLRSTLMPFNALPPLLHVYEDVKCLTLNGHFTGHFTGQNPAEAKSFNGVLLGFSKLFRKLYTAEVYSEVANMFRRV